MLSLSLSFFDARGNVEYYVHVSSNRIFLDRCSDRSRTIYYIIRCRGKYLEENFILEWAVFKKIISISRFNNWIKSSLFRKLARSLILVKLVLINDRCNHLSNYFFITISNQAVFQASRYVMATLERMYVTPFVISVIYTISNYYVLTSFTIIISLLSLLSHFSYHLTRFDA